MPHFALLVAAVFGFALKRGEMCILSGITDCIDHRSLRAFRGFFKISLWAALFGWGFWWWLPGAKAGDAFPVTLATVIGGAAFGIGAAINGGCFFGSFSRLSGGDLTFLLTFIGWAAGASLQGHVPWPLSTPVPRGLSPVAQPNMLGLMFFALAIILCLREIVSLSRGVVRQDRVQEMSIPLIGATGAFLYATNGAWAYPLAAGPATGSGGIPALSAATLFGGFLAAVYGSKFRVRFA